MSDLDTRPSSFGVPVLPPADGARPTPAVSTGAPLPAPTTAAVAVPVPPPSAGRPEASSTPIAGVTDRSQDVIDPPRRLLPHTPLRTAAVVANLAALPFGILATVGEWSDEARGVFLLGALVAPVVSFVSIVLWSAVASINARRVRSRNKHLRLPGAFDAALSWFTPVVLVVGLALANSILSTGDETGVERLQSLGGGSEELGFAIAGAAILVVLVAMYRPYSVMRKVSRWVSGDEVRFRTWFLAPLLGAALSGLIIVFSALVGLSDEGVPPLLVATALVVASALPWVFWLVAGNRAMADLEAATQRLYGRVLEEHLAEKASIAER